jgi:hypothetical protein
MAEKPAMSQDPDIFLVDKLCNLVDPSPTFGLKTPTALLPEIQKAKMEANNDYTRHTAMDKLDRLV